MSSNSLSRFYCNVKEEYGNEETAFDHGNLDKYTKENANQMT